MPPWLHPGMSSCLRQDPSAYRVGRSSQVQPRHVPEVPWGRRFLAETFAGARHRLEGLMGSHGDIQSIQKSYKVLPPSYVGLLVGFNHFNSPSWSSCVDDCLTRTVINTYFIQKRLSTASPSTIPGWFGVSFLVWQHPFFALQRRHV